MAKACRAAGSWEIWPCRSPPPPKRKHEQICDQIHIKTQNRTQTQRIPGGAAERRMRKNPFCSVTFNVLLCVCACRYHTGICLHGDHCWNLICCFVMMQPDLKSGLLSGARSVLGTGRGSDAVGVSVCGGSTFQRTVCQRRNLCQIRVVGFFNATRITSVAPVVFQEFRFIFSSKLKLFQHHF